MKRPKQVVVSGFQDLSEGAFSLSYYFPKDGKLCWLSMHATDEAGDPFPITETITFTSDSPISADYDTLLKSVSLAAAADYFWAPESLQFARSQALAVAITAAGGVGIVYVTMQVELER